MIILICVTVAERVCVVSDGLVGGAVTKQTRQAELQNGLKIAQRIQNHHESAGVQEHLDHLQL